MKFKLIIFTSYCFALLNLVSETQIEEIVTTGSFLKSANEDYFLIDTEVIKFNYRIDNSVDSVKSVSLKKSDEINGKLIGIKGQYLIFEDSSVFNVRSNEGYLIDLTID